MSSSEARLERLKTMIELMYGPKGAAEAARRMGFSNSGLATTLRGERPVTDNLELRAAKLVMEDIPRILENLNQARDLATDAMRDLMGPELWSRFEQQEEVEFEVDVDEESARTVRP